MKRIILLLCILCLSVPIVAQDDLTETYEFETGTTIDYPKGWEAEEVDGLVIIASNDNRQIIVVDYPIVSVLPEDLEQVATGAVEVLANTLLGTEINPDDIYTFELDNRVVTAYDINFSVSGFVYAIEFTNGAIGMIVTAEIDNDLSLDILSSFDNSQELTNDVALPIGRNSVVRDVPTVFLFESNQRFIYPANWIVNARRRDTLEYTTLSAPDNDDVTVQLFDLSQTITKGTELEEALSTVEDINWEDDFDFAIDNDFEPYVFGDRDAIQYELEVDGSQGSLIILRYSDDNIGMVAIFGEDIADYELDIIQIIGSFNNLGAVLDYMR